MAPRYVELHCHSAFSFLDGASHPEELAVRAAELGYPALALTDHDGVYGSLEFAHAAKHAGIRPITGAEVTLEGGRHVTLLCESGRGYANGGFVGGRPSTGGTDFSGVVELGPSTRSWMRQNIKDEVNIAIGDQTVAKASSSGSRAIYNRGGGQ